MGIEADINLAILKAIEASALSPVAYPNVNFSGDKPYYRVFLLPAKTEPFGVVSSNIYNGIVQIDIVGVEGIGQPKIDVLISAALAVFPRNKLLIEETTKVRFDSTGWASPPVQDKDEYFVPVNFMYLSIAKES